MSELVIHSSLRDYTVKFVEDFSAPLEQAVAEGGFVICDKNVFELYKDRILQAVEVERFFVLEAKEENKSLDKCQEIIKVLVERKVRRNNHLIALGGGVIQDVTAFIASILYRGIDWSFFPTTLLAQGDSCIGSKTSINLGSMKNLVGNFYPPKNIFIDPSFLDTLEIKDIKSGIGEMLHFYYYANSPNVKKIIENYDLVINSRKLLVDFIRESLGIKKSVIEIDEFDKGERNKFNYGHTFGHALETVTDYGIPHGQAVTVGMDLANFLSWKIGLLSREKYEDMHAELSINFPAFDLSTYSIDDYFTALKRDKKNIGDCLGCVLSKGPGNLVCRQVPFNDDLKGNVNSYFYEVFKLKFK